MASVHPIDRTDGSTAYKVRWREAGRQHSLTFDDKRGAEAVAKRITALGRAPDDLFKTPAHDGTVADAVDRHLSQLVGIQPDTRAEYERIARTHLAPLGDLLLVDVDRDVLARWVGGLDLSPKSVKNIHGLLSAVMATAVRDGLLDRNPCVGMRLPRTDGHEQRFLTYDEFTAVRAAIQPWAVPLLDFLAGTGARFGEASALTIRDISDGTARIAKAWKRTPDGWRVGPPKTRRSRRTIWLPHELALPDLERPGDALLFVAPHGGRVTQGTFHRAFTTAARATITPPVPRVHDLRHTHAAWLIAQGVGLATIQDRLGHESIQTTVNVYGHLVSDLRKSAADAAGAVWRTTPAIEG